MNSARILRFAVGLGCLIVAFVVWLSATGANAPGLTWDEAFYYPTYLDVRGWFALFTEAPNRALSAEGIAAGWSRINELPPVTKLLGALAISPDPLGPGALAWMRVVPAVCFALTLWMLFSIGSQLGGPRTGVLAAGLYACHPLLVGHAQIAATETLYSAINLGVVWLALRVPAPGGWRQWLLLAAAAGIALATKVNAVVLLIALAGWLLAGRAIGRGRLILPRGRELLALAVILVVAPLTAFAIWPWMWADPVNHLRGYIDFVRLHAHQGVWFFGERMNFGGPMAPVWYPAVQLAIGSPVLWLGLVGAGIAFWVSTAAQRARIRRGELLLALLALGPFLASSLPSSPKYDGIRLFLPMMAPLVVLAALGIDRAIRGFLPRRRFVVIAPALVVVAIVAAEIPALRTTPRLLAYHNTAAHLAFADARPFPFDATFWGDALDVSVRADLNRLLPPNARVKTLALQQDAFKILQGWGQLRGDIVFDGPPPYDAHLIQNRKGFWGRSEWDIVLSRDPLAAWHPTGPTGEWLIALYDGRPPGTVPLRR